MKKIIIENKRDLLEKLASLEHEQWIHWTNGLKGVMADWGVAAYNVVVAYEGEEYNPEEMDNLMKTLWQRNSALTNRLLRWDTLNKPYNELSEKYKEEDRVHARRVLDLLEHDPIQRLNNKSELLTRLYNLEYMCKVSGFGHEANEITQLILDLEKELYGDKNPRGVICKSNCELCKTETEGHGWVSHTCLATGHDAPLEKECGISEETFNRLDRKYNYWRY